MNEEKKTVEFEHITGGNAQIIFEFAKKEQELTEQQYDDTRANIKDLENELNNERGNLITLMSVNNYYKNLLNYLQKEFNIKK